MRIVTTLTTTLLLIGTLAIIHQGCKQNDQSPKRGSTAADDSRNRPDSEGIAPPGWYLAGAKIHAISEFDGSQARPRPDVELRHQSCSFVKLAGVDTFYWEFTDSESLTPQKQLSLSIETSQLPSSGSDWLLTPETFPSQFARYQTGMNDPINGGGSYWSTAPTTSGINNSKCSLHVSNSLLTSQNITTDSGKDMKLFFIMGKLECKNMRLAGAESNRYIDLSATVGCDGVLLKEDFDSDTFEYSDPATNLRWAFRGYLNYQDTKNECEKMGSGYRLPVDNELQGKILINTPIGNAINKAPTSSNFVWTYDKNNTSTERISVMQMNYDSSGNMVEMDGLCCMDKSKNIGSGLCVKSN